MNLKMIKSEIKLHKNLNEMKNVIRIFLASKMLKSLISKTFQTRKHSNFIEKMLVINQMND